jgi:hypothetical protein
MLLYHSGSELNFCFFLIYLYKGLPYTGLNFYLYSLYINYIVVFLLFLPYYMPHIQLPDKRLKENFVDIRKGNILHP